MARVTSRRRGAGESQGRSRARRIAAWSQKEIDPDGRRRFAELAETELINLHEGNFARYRVRPSEFAAWRQIWEAR